MMRKINAFDQDHRDISLIHLLALAVHPEGPDLIKYVYLAVNLYKK